MKELLLLPDERVHCITRAAFRDGLQDHERIDAISELPGYGSGGAFTSVLFTAWELARYGVFDRIVEAKQVSVTNEQCTCNWRSLPVYWAHLRNYAHQMTADDARAGLWSARDVEMGILNAR